MLSVDGFIKSVKIYKNLEKLYNKKSWLFMTRKIGRLINESAFRFFKRRHLILYNFSKFLYNFYTFIHPSTLNITNKTPHSHDDGSAEMKCYSVDWLCFSINPHFLFGLLVVNFSSQIVGLLSIIFFHIYIYPQRDCFVVSQIFIVSRHLRCFKLD